MGWIGAGQTAGVDDRGLISTWAVQTLRGRADGREQSEFVKIEAMGECPG